MNTVEHSVYVDPAVHRQGIGRALLQTLIARAERACLKVMVGGVDANNQGSIALHEQLGFENQGCLKGVGYKFGQPLDLVSYGQTALNRGSQPRAPRSAGRWV